MRLADVVGQDRALAVLRESVGRGRLHHALLFSGPDGVGKSSTARALAAWLLCEQPEPTDSCGSCGACAQVAAGTHPDFHFETFGLDDRGRPRREILIEQVRSVQTSLTRTALAGGRKIAIVDEAQALNRFAQNAFLKTLEEPPGNSLIVLVARNGGALLPTVRSRCQRIPFRPLADAELETLLREKHGRSAAEARALAAYAEGSPGAALAIDPAALTEAEERLTGLLAGCRRGLHKPVVEAAGALAAENGPLGLPLLLRILRRQLREAAGLAREGELTPGGKPGTLTGALQAAEHAYRTSADLKRNANPAIALERMWLGIGEALGHAD